MTTLASFKDQSSRGAIQIASPADLKMILGDSYNQRIDDAQFAAQFNIQTATYIEQRVFEVKYRQTKYQTLLPINTSAPQYAGSITEYSSDYVGEAGFISEAASDIPNVETSMRQHLRQVHMNAIGYNYSIAEIGVANEAGLDVLVRKAMAARKSYEFLMDRVGLIGNAAHGFEGLYNASTVTAQDVADTGNGGSRLWEDKTERQILADLNEPLNTIVTNTQGTELPDTIVLPISAFNFLATTYRPGDSDMSLLDAFRKANAYTAATGNDIKIIGDTRLETLGAASTRRMVVYPYSNDILEFAIPMPLQFMEPHKKTSLSVEVAGISRTAGLFIRYPSAVAYRDGF